MGRNTVFAIAFIAVLMSVGALVLALKPASASSSGGCAVVCVTSLNSLTGALTLSHFSSLNMTTVGNTLTLGLNLGHANTWTAVQSSTKWMNVGLFNLSQSITACNSCAQLFTDTGTNVYGNYGGSVIFNTPQGYGDYFRANGANVLTFNSPYPSGTAYMSFYSYDLALNSFPFYFQDTFGGANLFGLSSTGIANTQGFQSFTCSLGAGSTTKACTLAVTEPDTSYYAVCSENSGNTVITAIEVVNTSTTVLTLNYNAMGVLGGTAYCMVVHQ